jgi:hypothetical protein
MKLKSSTIKECDEEQQSATSKPEPEEQRHKAVVADEGEQELNKREIDPIVMEAINQRCDQLAARLDVLEKKRAAEALLERMEAAEEQQPAEDGATLH